MKKNIKKIILVLCIILSVVGIVLTIIYAKNNIKNSFDSLLQLSNQNNQSFIPMNKNSIKLTTLYVVLIGTFCTIFSLCIVYLIMSIKNEKFYKIKDKIIIYILSNIVVIGYMLGTITIITNNFILNDKKIEQQTTKDKVTLDESNSVAESTIDLNNQSTDVTITKGGTYTFSGSFKHSIIVDAENENVEIVLNGVNITTENTATIIGLNANKITITLNENTTNVLTEGYTLVRR